MDHKAIEARAYQKGYEAGVKEAVAKMRLMLQPRDIDQHPDCIPYHWYLDHILRMLASEKQ